MTMVNFEEHIRMAKGTRARCGYCQRREAMSGHLRKHGWKVIPLNRPCCDDPACLLMALILSSHMPITWETLQTPRNQKGYGL